MATPAMVKQIEAALAAEPNVQHASLIEVGPEYIIQHTADSYYIYRLEGRQSTLQRAIERVTDQDSQVTIPQDITVLIP